MTIKNCETCIDKNCAECKGIQTDYADELTPTQSNVISAILAILILGIFISTVIYVRVKRANRPFYKQQERSFVWDKSPPFVATSKFILDDDKTGSPAYIVEWANAKNEKQFEQHNKKEYDLIQIGESREDIHRKDPPKKEGV